MMARIPDPPRPAAPVPAKNWPATALTHCDDSEFLAAAAVAAAAAAAASFSEATNIFLSPRSLLFKFPAPSQELETHYCFHASETNCFF
jgi:hypothetical protein